jgi:hypothetical protein
MTDYVNRFARIRAPYRIYHCSDLAAIEDIRRAITFFVKQVVT